MEYVTTQHKQKDMMEYWRSDVMIHSGGFEKECELLSLNQLIYLINRHLPGLW